MERQFFQSFPILLVIQLMTFHKFPWTLLSNLLDFWSFGCMLIFGGGVERHTCLHSGSIWWSLARGKFCVNHWQPVFDHVNHGFYDNMDGAPKTNMDTQDDGLEKVAPKRNGNCWYQFVRFLGCKFCVNHGLPKTNMVQNMANQSTIMDHWVFWSI